MNCCLDGVLIFEYPLKVYKVRLSYSSFLVSAACSTNASRSRHPNQDAFGADQGLFVVADGVTRCNVADQAASLAIWTMGEEMANLPQNTNSSKEVLGGVVEQVVARIYSESRAQTPSLKPLTTLVAARMNLGGRVDIASVGDSPIFRIRGGVITRLITEDDHDPTSHLLVQVVGARSVRVHLNSDQSQIGDTYLLCSDGLTNGLGDPQKIIGIVNTSATPEEACRNLIRAANDAGGPDHITVIVIRIMERPY